MTVLTGVFAELPGIENISGDSIQNRLKAPFVSHALENYVANRMLYPQTVSVTEEDKLIDSAILQEYLILNPAFFYNPLSHKLVIPLDLINRFQTPAELMTIFISLISFEGVVPVFIRDEGISIKAEGSIFVTSVPKENEKVPISINGMLYEVEVNKICQFPVADQHTRIKIDGTNEIIVTGGKLGVTIFLPVKK